MTVEVGAAPHARQICAQAQEYWAVGVVCARVLRVLCDVGVVSVLRVCVCVALYSAWHGHAGQFGCLAGL